MMSRLRKTGLGAVVLASSALLLGGLGGARAATYSLTACQDGGSGYCSGSPYGSVVVNITGGGTEATIQYTLTTGTIADPTDASLTFDLTGTITSASVTSGSGWGSVVTGGTEEIDYGEGTVPFGSFPDGASCNNSSGCGTSVTVTVYGTGLGVQNNTSGYFAALDTCSGYSGSDCQYGNNGAVATSVSATPLPGALAMLAPVLGGGFLALRRRRRKLSAAAA